MLLTLGFLNFIGMFFNIFVLIALLSVLYLKKILVTYKDGILVIVGFVLFFTVGMNIIKSTVSFKIKQNNIEKKVDSITNNTLSVYVNNELYEDKEKAKKVVQFLKNIHERYSHRGKNGTLSKPLNTALIIHLVGEKEELKYRLYQDNGRDYEYWVYDEKGYIGIVQTTLFLEHSKVREIEQKLMLQEKNKEKRKTVYIMIIASMVILSIIIQTVFLSNSFSGKEKKKYWNFFVFFSWLIGILFLYAMEVDGYLYFFGVTFFAFSGCLSVSFCSSCGALNSGEKSFQKVKYCNRCNEKI